MPGHYGEFFFQFPDLDSYLLEQSEKSIPYIRLNRQKINQVPDEQLQEVSPLYLDLSINALQSWPEKILKIRHLEWLNLRLNLFKQIPSLIFELNKLKGLDLGYNQIEHLEPGFSQLEHLQFLDLSANTLISFPESFSFPPGLTSLYLNDNPGIDWANLIENLLPLPGPLKLSLSACELHRLPDSIAYLHQLKSLSIADNPNLDLDHTLEKLESVTSLEFLDISNTSKSLSPQIAVLQNLKGLRYNHFSYKEKLPEWLPQLQYLDLSHNQWHKIPEWICRLKKLHTLVLKHNRLEQLPPRFSEKLPQLKKLDIRFNGVEQYPPRLSKLIAQLDDFKIDGNPGQYQKLLRKFLKILGKSELSYRQKEIAALLILGDLEAAFAGVSIHELLPLMATRMPVLCYAILHYIEKTSAIQGITFQEGTQIYMPASSPRFRLPEMRKFLKNKGLSIRSRLDTTADYYLISPLLRAPIQLPEGKGLLSDTQLFTFFQSKQNKASTENATRLRNLLQSPEESNQWLGLRILQGDDFPKELEADIAVLYFFGPSKKVKKECTKVIKKHFSYLLQFIFARIQYLSPETQIRTLLDSGQFDQVKLVNRIYDFCEKAVPYVIELGGRNFRPAIQSQINYNDVLSLRYNLKNIAPQIREIKGLKKIEVIGGNQSRLPWKEIPPVIFDLEELEYLRIDESQLRSISPKIGRLKKLKKLRLSIGQIKKLPVDILQLEKIEVFSVFSNFIEELPEGIGQLQNLKELWAFSNQVSHLPTSLFSLEKLERLHLSSNQIEKIPPDIHNLKSLKELSLANNQISEVAEEIAELKNLIKLDLSRNEGLGHTQKNRLRRSMPWCQIRFD